MVYMFIIWWRVFFNRHVITLQLHTPLISKSQWKSPIECLIMRLKTVLQLEGSDSQLAYLIRLPYWEACKYQSHHTFLSPNTNHRWRSSGSTLKSVEQTLTRCDVRSKQCLVVTMGTLLTTTRRLSLNRYFFLIFFFFFFCCFCSFVLFLFCSLFFCFSAVFLLLSFYNFFPIICLLFSECLFWRSCFAIWYYKLLLYRKINDCIRA